MKFIVYDSYHEQIVTNISSDLEDYLMHKMSLISLVFINKM